MDITSSPIKKIKNFKDTPKTIRRTLKNKKGGMIPTITSGIQPNLKNTRKK